MSMFSDDKMQDTVLFFDKLIRAADRAVKRKRHGPERDTLHAHGIAILIKPGEVIIEGPSGTKINTSCWVGEQGIKVDTTSTMGTDRHIELFNKMEELQMKLEELEK